MQPVPSLERRRPPIAPAFLAVFGPALVVSGLVPLAAWATGAPLSMLLDLDPNAGNPPWAGLLLKLSMAVLGGAVAVNGVAWALSRRAGHSREVPEFFLAAAGLSALFLLDSMLRARAAGGVTNPLGLDDLSLAAYLAACTAWGLRFRRILARTDHALLWTALGFLALSILVDRGALRFAHADFLEAASDLMAAAGWTGFFVREATRKMALFLAWQGIVPARRHGPPD